MEDGAVLREKAFAFLSMGGHTEDNNSIVDYLFVAAFLSAHSHLKLLYFGFRPHVSTETPNSLTSDQPNRVDSFELFS